MSRRVNPLSSLVVGNALGHWLEVLELFKITKQQDFWFGNCMKLTRNHIPSIVERLQVVIFHDQRLEAARVVQRLATVSGRVVPKDNGE